MDGSLSGISQHAPRIPNTFWISKKLTLRPLGQSMAAEIPFWTGSDRNDQDRTGLYLEFLGMPQGFRNTFRISKKSTFKPLWRLSGASLAPLWRVIFHFGQDQTGMIRIARFRIWQFSACPKDSKTLFGFQKSRRLSLSGASLAVSGGLCRILGRP